MLDQAPKDEINNAVPAPPLSKDHGATDNHPRTGLTSPPPAEEPVPLQWSSQLRKVPTCPSNIYGDGRHYTEVEKDVSGLGLGKIWWVSRVAPTPNQSLLQYPLEDFLIVLRVRICNQTQRAM